MTPETPAQARSAAKAAAARMLRAALHAADLDQSELARLVGVPSQRVQRWCDTSERETMSVADLRNAPRAVVMHMMRWLGEAHHAVVVDELDATGDGSHYEHLARMLGATGAVATSYATSLADGQVDAVERERLIPLLRESIREQQAVLVMLESERAPVRAVRGGR